MRILRGLNPRALLRLRYLPAYLKDPSISLVKKGLIVLGMLYIISPVDAIPDLVPVLGWLDDIGVLGILVASLMRELEDYGSFAPRRLAK